MFQSGSVKAIIPCFSQFVVNVCLPSVKWHRKIVPYKQCSNVKYFTSNKQYNSKMKGKLITMKIDTPEYHALFTPELKTLISMFEKNQYEIRIAGGPVRDLLMGKACHDIDLATTATPTQMKEMFELEGIRMINKKGESHGTITARINDKENYEVTTLRIDIRTDGRHAEVEFTKDWQLDANRRDLTINAMFLGVDGTVYDYFNGIEDVKKRKVRFVGEPADRIQEDFLRILRYFRFYGRIAEGPDEHEEATLTAIQANADGLKDISGERIWTELKKIIVGNHAASILKTMVQTGITQYIGLPSQLNLEELEAVCERTDGTDPAPMTRIAALLSNTEQVYQLNERLKVSTEELKTCLFVVTYRDRPETEPVFRHYQHLVAGLSGKDSRTQLRAIELLKYKGNSDARTAIENWTQPRLPVTGKDLIDMDLKKGPTFAKLLSELRLCWIESDFQLSREELVDKIPALLKDIRS
ncbi:CCA tRNA nucleotidyltransferase 1, mitochondrial-like isoform X2 [Mya arenaria]|nr:CCA tRNA nucleotidyltransferase 1, mitochondrial-like isoform X2 [Mya arenaria]